MKRFKNEAEMIADLKGVISRTKQKSTEDITTQFIKDCQPLVPKATGMTVDSALIDSDVSKGIARWTTPYVRFIFFGSPGWNWTTAGTGPMWAEIVKSRNKEKYKAFARTNFAKEKKR